MKKSCIAMLLAGGQGSRLYALTQDVAKPSVPFGGKHRIIDFPLSNCANSGIDTVGVLTQYRPLKLNSYIGSGQPWDLDVSDGGVYILPPYLGAHEQGSWFSGTANAIYQNIAFIEMYDPDNVLILSGDHIYKMDYAEMLRAHLDNEAACTIAVQQVSMAEATRMGIMSVDEKDFITEFEEKPKQPKSDLASMGIYIFNWKKLKAALVGGSSSQVSDAVSAAVDMGAYKLVIARLDNIGGKDLRGVWDTVRDKLGADCACVLASVADGKVGLLAAGTDSAVAAGFAAGNVIKEIAGHVGGRGGGRPNMAQAGGSDASGIDAALDAAKSLLNA